MSTSLSPTLRSLLERHVESFEKLELLMLLHRAQGEARTVADLSRELDVDRDELRVIIGALAGAGLIARGADGAISLAPRSTADRAALDELARVYDEDKVVIVKAIAETAMDRLRNLAGRAFAEAFVIRKKPGGDDDR